MKAMKRKQKNEETNNSQFKSKKRKLSQDFTVQKLHIDAKVKDRLDHTLSKMKNSEDLTKTLSALENFKVSETKIKKRCDSGHKMKSEKLKQIKKKKQCESEVTDCARSNKNQQSGDKKLKHSFRHKKLLSKRKKRKLAKKEETSSSTIVVKPPEKPEEFSSNWKQLLSVLEKTEPKKMSKHMKKPSHRQSSTGDQIKMETGLKKQNAEKQHEEKRTPEVWFDDVDEILIEKHNVGTEKDMEDKNTAPLIKLGSYKGLTKVVSMDCEMVGVGREGKEDMLARVSVVNQYGHCVYDQFVKPMEHVVDYRTHVSGVRKEDLDKGIEFSVVQKEVADVLKNRTLVGHAIHNDLKVLYLSHPKKKIRDTSRYKPFRTLFNGRIPSLKKLTAQVLSVKVQEGEHDSVQDAQAAMRLYTMYRQQWEKDIKHVTSKKNTKSA